jgi:hypothetical protein
MSCQSNYINKLKETRELNTSDDSETNRGKKTALPSDIMVQQHKLVEKKIILKFNSVQGFFLI